MSYQGTSVKFSNTFFLMPAHFFIHVPDYKNLRFSRGIMIPNNTFYLYSISSAISTDVLLKILVLEFCSKHQFLLISRGDKVLKMDCKALPNTHTHSLSFNHNDLFAVDAAQYHLRAFVLAGVLLLWPTWGRYLPPPSPSNGCPDSFSVRLSLTTCLNCNLPSIFLIIPLPTDIRFTSTVCALYTPNEI